MTDALRGHRAFNRFELKYVVPAERLDSLAGELEGRMEQDPHGGRIGYEVWSRYYDSPGLRFYWEKIDGIKFRRKLRIRTYGDPSRLTDDSEVFVEIKQRINRVTQKRRVAMSHVRAGLICSGARGVVPAHPVGKEAARLAVSLGLQPQSVIGYHRRALVGTDADPGLRVTFDTSIRARDGDLDLGSGSHGLAVIPPHLAIVEVKVNERVPRWLVEVCWRRSLTLVRVSKYCRSIERFGRAPRSSLPYPFEPKIH